MSNFQGSFLRVLEPRTTNGVNLKFDKDNKVMYKETHMPLSALKGLKALNAKLPKHLRLIIEQAGDPVDAPQFRNGKNFRPATVPRVNPQPETKKKKETVNEEL